MEKHIQLCWPYALVAPAVLWAGHYYLLTYWAVMLASVLFLNSQTGYLALRNARFYNWLFTGYLVVILFNRSRRPNVLTYSEEAEAIINIVEHAFFALVLCSKVMVYLGLFTRWSGAKLRLAIVALFNLLGLLNEIFQNWVHGIPLFVINAESQKDMAVNLVGSVFFYFWAQHSTRS